MIIGYASVSTTEHNLGLDHDDLKPAFDASVDQTEARKEFNARKHWTRRGRRIGDHCRTCWLYHPRGGISSLFFKQARMLN